MINALLPWFGSSRLVAERIGHELKGAKHVTIPFAGGLAELKYINASTILVSDLHRHAINLARVVISEKRQALIRKLQRLPFHPDVLEDAQTWCKENEPDGNEDLEAAINYFVSQWMGRSGLAGTDDEFRGNLSVRWSGGGGDSNTRFRSATKALVFWFRIMRKCNFIVADAKTIIANVPDQEGNAIYADPPWFEDGEKYRHKFTDQDQATLATMLTAFNKTKVVVRLGDHPKARLLYPRSKWRAIAIQGRTQSNGKKAEVLFVSKR